MIVLLAPPRSGSSLMTKVLERLTGSEIQKVHFAEWNADKTILLADKTIEINVNDIEMLFYCCREPLSNATSFTLFDVFNVLQPEEVYHAFLNSPYGLLRVVDNILRWIKFGFHPFSEFSGKKHLIDYSMLMHEPNLALQELANFYGLSEDESQLFINDYPEISEKSFEAKMNSSGGSHDQRLLKSRDIEPANFIGEKSRYIIASILYAHKIKLPSIEEWGVLEIEI